MVGCEKNDTLKLGPIVPLNLNGTFLWRKCSGKAGFDNLTQKRRFVFVTHHIWANGPMSWIEQFQGNFPSKNKYE